MKIGARLFFDHFIYMTINHTVRYMYHLHCQGAKSKLRMRE
jgi:hypothetical protein